MSCQKEGRAMLGEHLPSTLKHQKFGAFNVNLDRNSELLPI